MNKRDNAHKSIGELCKILGLIDKSSGKKKDIHYKILGKKF